MQINRFGAGEYVAKFGWSAVSPHAIALQPGAHGFLDRGERRLTSLLVGIPDRIAHPADSDAGQGDPRGRKVPSWALRSLKMRSKLRGYV